MRFTLPSKLRTAIALGRDISESLKIRNELLKRQLEVIDHQSQLLIDQTEQLGKIRWHTSEAREIGNEIRGSLAAQRLDEMTSFLKERQLGLVETIETVRDKRLNFARFGDGEFKLMLQVEYNARFQRNSIELMDALENVIERAASQPDKLLLGMPHPHRDRFWGSFYSQMWGQMSIRLEPLEVLGNSQTTRPVMFSACGMRAVNAWRSVWDGLDVTIVTGRGSRFDMIPELFDNVRSVHFEYSEPVHAFNDIPRLLRNLEHSTADVVLISLGQSGTILASELCDRNQWALDIGHLSSSYDRVHKAGLPPEQLPFIQ